MLVLNDVKALISAYRWIERNCELIDEFVYKHSVNFGPTPEYFSTYDVTNNIINLIERKNRLINVKLIIDELIDGMQEEDKRVLLIKMRYNLSMESFCKVMQIQSLRTAFRRINRALERFLVHANNSPYKNKLEYILDNEDWICNIRRNVEEKYKQACL